MVFSEKMVIQALKIELLICGKCYTSTLFIESEYSQEELNFNYYTINMSQICSIATQWEVYTRIITGVHWL